MLTELLRLVPGASPILCQMLDGVRGPVQPPIRSEIFGLQRFAQHGRSLGETHRAERPSLRAASFFPRLRDNIHTLNEAHRYIGAQAATGYDVSPAAEWLLDNFHLIEAQLEEIHAGLPRSYFRALPVLQDEPLAGLPRVYGIAWAFVAHTDGAFDEALLVQFLSAYQETRELNLAEMWALPTTLRVVLVESLRRLAERVATNKAAREVANLCCDHLDSTPTTALDALLALMHQRGVGRMFLTHMALRLQDSRSTTESAVHDWLQAALPDFAAAQTQHNVDQAADNLSVSNAVKSLRAIGDADWPDIVSRTSVLMQRMLASPIFEAEHPRTRDATLHGIERLAKHSGHSEASVAQTLLGLMQTGSPLDASTGVPSYWLEDAGRPVLVKALGLHENTAVLWRAITRRAALPAYLGALGVGTIGLVAWMLHHPTGGAGLALLSAALMLLPASEAMVAILNRLISESVRPQHLPRLGLLDGIPPAHRVMVVIPAMLDSAASARALVHRLHLHYIANPEPCAQFGLLTDWVDADTERTPADADLLSAAMQGISALNLRYPTSLGVAPRFILLHRERSFSQSEQRWIGWERKRGKLEQLVDAMATDSTAAFMYLGDTSRIAARTPYIVTLDSDTQLPPGRLRELVGVAAHPHNQPRLDASGRSVVQGYGILQPRVATPLPARKDFTLYHWLFAGQCGIDPYSAATSEVYQDVFGEGSFTGKGLLHVQALHAVLSGRLPEGQVLSHDLLEGSLARCAAVTDVSVIEDAPFHADVAASRVHRWTRGDWQLLAILLNSGRYPLRGINVWKMFDNLRRSLVAPASLLLLLLTLCTPTVSPWAALALVAAAFSAGPLMGAVAGFSPSRDDLAKRHFYRQAGSDLARTLWGGLWHVAQLLMHAVLAVDAIARALYRLFVSHRHLLQWTTAATAQAQARTHLPTLVRAHWSLPVVALLLLVGLLAVGTPYPALAVVLCLLWAASPVWIWWTSRPRASSEDAPLPAADLARLHGIARDTWRWFERCIGPDDNYLPPDNLQTLPVDMLAHRTSPTNIGLYLLSVACARQFGWIGTQDLLERLEATLTTLGRMQRHRGHFYNWYDTQTCAPLLPLYVSTVDSGNLSGHLLAVAQACREMAAAPHPSQATQATHSALNASRDRIAPLLAARSSLPPAQREQLRWMLADHRATRRSAERDRQTSSRDDAPRLQALAHTMEEMAWAADYHFLYHRKRHLLHIGYRVAERQLDAGFYDLLASESRLTSLLAIAKGDVPVRHWASLGRPFYAIGADAGLRSWSGSMFEYLMPTLVLVEPPGSVLQQACHAALQEQMAYAQAHKVPWGISESAYAGQDHTLAYQYAPQGVPRLALRRTPIDELVIAPYATGLAVLVAPALAATNFIALENLGARGRYGFIEALDFTPARQAQGEAFTPVCTFMAHHQGMTLVALANLLLDGPAQRWGMANPSIEAVTSLLHERAPREVSLLSAPPAAPPTQLMQQRAPGLLREVVPGGTALEPTHLLSNGRYHVALRANGAGWSRRGGTGITRWRDDALRDAYGSFFYLRWGSDQPLVSITQHPAPDPAADCRSTFHADRVCFDAEWPGVQAHTTVWVSPEDDIEFRQVELRNLGDQPLEIELVSAFEATLSDARADEAHPAFTNLFIRAQWQAEDQALVFERSPRLPTEQALQAAHFMVDTDPQVQGLRIQTDRQHWLGRNRDASQPLARLVAPPAPGSSTALDTGLDPVCAIAVQLRIAPHGKARLTFATAASDNAETLQAVVDKYRQHTHVKRSSLMSATLTGIRLRTWGLAPDSLVAIQTLTSALALSLARPTVRTGPDGMAPVSDRRLLWRFGISGDRPILLVSASAMEGLGLLRALAQALKLWSWGGLGCDLVVVNAEPASYLMALHREIGILRDRHAADRGGESAPTTMYLLRADELTPDEFSTLHAQARVRLLADGRPLLHHVQAWSALHEKALEARHATATVAVPLVPHRTQAVPAPTGVFTAEGDFRFDVSPALRTVRPWTNVLANPGFGAHITEAGGGYSWGLNSRLNQLTAWSNDPVGDTPSEWFLLQDRKTLEVWSVTPNAWADPQAVYHVAHGQGSTTIRHRRGDIDVAATWCVDPDTSVKHVRLHTINRGHRPLQLRIIGMAEWLMGANRSDRSSVHMGVFQHGATTALLCTQRERSAGFGEGTAFLALAGDGDHAVDDWTCDRRECFDARGHLVLPDHFGHATGAGLDPCAALSTTLHLAAGDTADRVFLLGFAANPLLAREVVLQAAAVEATQRLASARAHWDALLGATVVATPDPLFDAMVNHWLLYQTVACRLWAKSGFYQAGGATGFRDQLQDAMALAWAAPGMLREQITVCAARQFPEGDVQHWWHAPNGAGVRTHFSDDLLWLPHACAHYLRSTGDATLLEVQVPFLEGAAIPEGAEDAYYTPAIGMDTATVYEHAARTIDRSLAVGVHGLPLMGSGDWNDGMNRVGIEGQGESVWLGWFLCQVVAEFAPLAHARGDTARARRWEQAAEGWRAALVGPAWDGQWFKRAFFDNGEALGSHANPEAQIDLIAQAWAVLSHAAPVALQRIALTAMEERLVDPQAGLIKLLDPPLAHAVPSAGYIQAYPPGVRENGGQYSHAGVWAMMAQAAFTQGQPDSSVAQRDTAYRYFTYLNPAHRAANPRHNAAYAIEPYVMAGDVYTQPPYVGRGGWSWYTGSAAWMHRAAIASIFGLEQGADTLRFTPCLPSHWPQAEMTLRRGERSMRFIFTRGAPEAALAAHAHSNARLLHVGEALPWAGLAAQSCFVVPL